MTTVSEGAKALQDYFGYVQRHNRDPHNAQTRDDYMTFVNSSPAYSASERTLCAEQSKLVIELKLNRPNSLARPMTATPATSGRTLHTAGVQPADDLLQHRV